MPMVGLALGGVDFSEFFAVLRDGDPVGPYATLAATKMKREEEEAPEPTAPPEPTAEETLLTEIRDILEAQA